MSSSSVPANVISMNGWNDETRQVPALKWLENYTKNTIDTRTFMSGGEPSGHADGWTLTKADGTRVQGRAASWKALGELYGVFAAHHHDPRFITAWETADGWEAFGWAEVFFQCHGPAPESKTDSNGDKWHGSGPGAFYFIWEGKNESDLKLKETVIFSDSTPAVRVMLENKHITGDQLAGIILGGA